ASANRSANLGHQEAAFGRQRQDLSQWDLEVFLDVVAQRFQWRNVEDFGAIAQRAFQRLAHEAVNADEKSGQCFARTGRSGDQRGPAGKNLWPTLLLR